MIICSIQKTDFNTDLVKNNIPLKKHGSLKSVLISIETLLLILRKEKYMTLMPPKGLFQILDSISTMPEAIKMTYTSFRQVCCLMRLVKTPPSQTPRIIGITAIAPMISTFLST